VHRPSATVEWQPSDTAAALLYLSSGDLVQVVVQGIPWKYRDEDLAALFEDCAVPEEAKVVISKDGRSRVGLPIPCLCCFAHMWLPRITMPHHPGLMHAGVWHCAIQLQGRFGQGCEGAPRHRAGRPYTHCQARQVRLLLDQKLAECLLPRLICCIS
jgi:hypothetical protein